MIFAWSGLWPMVSHYGIAGTALLACAAVAYFLPPFRRDAIWAAVVIFVGVNVYTLGVRDEAKFCKAQEVVAATKAQRAHDDAVARVERDRRKPGGLRHDKYDRDGQK